METKELIEKYEKYLKRKKLNEKTIINYIYDLKAFDSYIEKSLEDVTEEDINNLIREKRRNGMSANRINFTTSVLTSFYRYLNSKSYVKNNPMKNVIKLKVPKKEESFLTFGKIKEIRKKLEEENNLQLEVFFALMCCGCPRKNSISKIEWRKINWKKMYIEIVVDENTRGIIYLDNYAIKKLEELRKERHKMGLKRKHVFLTKYKGWNPITDSTLTRWLNNIAKLGGVEDLTFGIMKNTCREYLKKQRRFSEEQINKIFSWRSFEFEFRSLVLDEIEKLKEK